MELKEFIKTAIKDITEAVSELQSELDNGAFVSPSMPNAIANVTFKDPANRNINRKISNIDFDVALTVGDSGVTGKEGKLGIQILSAKVCGENKSHTENVSKIAFSIPVALPAQHVESVEEKHDETCSQQKAEVKDMKRIALSAEFNETTNS